MNKKGRLLEKGQSLIIVVILAFVFLAMLALVLDGGYSYFQRRLAQNAADAGALAAADTLCETESWVAAEADGIHYAVVENEAHTAVPTQVGERMVKVDTSITFNTFFASLIGQPEVTAYASATAGCYPPKELEGVMPVAWSCREPILGENWSSDDCAFLYGNTDNPNLGQRYIIMDGIKLGPDMDESAACQDPTKDPADRDPTLVDCDLDDDGINDVMTGGERSWLDLDGGSSSANELSDWIEKIETPELQTHIWLVGSDGNKASVYKSAKLREGDNVILPVFNQHCDMKNDPSGAKNLEDTDCYNDFIAIDEEGETGGDPHLGETTSGVYFHIISFAVFHVECVEHKQSHDCPMKNLAELAGLADHNTKTIEGYFLRGYVPQASGGPNNNPWVGAYTVYLID